MAVGKFYISAFAKIGELQEIILRYCTMDMTEPVCVYIAKNEQPDVSVFIGEEGDVLAVCDKNGEICYEELVDLCVISMAKDVVTNEEYRFVVEYTWFEEETYREFNERYNMDLFRKLFFEKWYDDSIKRTQNFFVKNKNSATFDYR